MQNKVFIATSLDGYIADLDGSIDWLTNFPNPSQGDAGYSEFMNSIDAIIMGRKTFEKVLSFGIAWPYDKKVFVWTKTLTTIPVDLENKVEILAGSAEEVLKKVHSQNYKNIYVDGGQTIQGFLEKGLINEITITQVPVLLGKGIPLFKNIERISLEAKSVELFDNGMIQSKFVIKK